MFYSERKIAINFFAILGFLIFSGSSPFALPAAPAGKFITPFSQYFPANSFIYSEIKIPDDDAQSFLQILDILVSAGDTKKDASISSECGKDLKKTDSTKPSEFFNHYFLPEMAAGFWFLPCEAAATASDCAAKSNILEPLNKAASSTNTVLAAMTPSVGMSAMPSIPSEFTKYASESVPNQFLIVLRVKDDTLENVLAQSKEFSKVERPNMHSKIYLNAKKTTALGFDNSAVLISSDPGILIQALAEKNNSAKSLGTPRAISEALGKLSPLRSNTFYVNSSSSLFQNQLAHLNTLFLTSKTIKNSEKASQFITYYLDFMASFSHLIGPDLNSQMVGSVLNDKDRQVLDIDGFSILPNWEKIPDAPTRESLKSYYAPTLKDNANLSAYAGENTSIIIGMNHLDSLLGLFRHVFAVSDMGKDTLPQIETAMKLTNVDPQKNIIDLFKGTTGIIIPGLDTKKSADNSIVLMGNTPSLKANVESRNDGVFNILLEKAETKQLHGKKFNIYRPDPVKSDKKEDSYFGLIDPLFYGYGTSAALDSLPVLTGGVPLSQTDSYKVASEGIDKKSNNFVYIDFEKLVPDTLNSALKKLIINTNCETAYCHFQYRVQYQFKKQGV